MIVVRSQGSRFQNIEDLLAEVRARPGLPDDGVLLNLLARWLPDERQRRRVLVDNPAALYDFKQRKGQR